jgi:hypothetical protein
MPDHLNCIFSVDLYSGLMSKLCLRLLYGFYVHLLQYFIQYSSNMFICTCLGTICEYLVRNDSSIIVSDTVLFLHCTSICQEVGKKNVSQNSWPLACNSKSGPSVCRHSTPYVYISGRSGASGAECACGQLHVCTVPRCQGEIQTTARGNMIGRSKTAPPLVSSPSSILSPPMSHCPFIPTRNNSAFVSKLLLFYYIYFVLFFTFFKLCESGIA